MPGRSKKRYDFFYYYWYTNEFTLLSSSVSSPLRIGLVDSKGCTDVGWKLLAETPPLKSSLPSFVVLIHLFYNRMLSEMSRSLNSFHGGKFNFTIDHILNVAGEKEKEKTFRICLETRGQNEKFEWLTCTRYKPPKLPRERKKGSIRQRKLGRNPRIPFSSSQVAFLESQFLQSPYLSSAEVTRLAAHLKLTETRVKIWFQNRRAREKKEYSERMKMNESLKQPITCNFAVFPQEKTNERKFQPTNQLPPTYVKVPDLKSDEHSKTAPLDLTLTGSNQFLKNASEIIL